MSIGLDCRCRIDWPRLYAALGLTYAQLGELMQIHQSSVYRLVRADQHSCPHASSVALLRMWIVAQADYRARLTAARYEWPYPEDLSG